MTPHRLPWTALAARFRPRPAKPAAPSPAAANPAPVTGRPARRPLAGLLAAAKRTPDPTT